MELNGIGIGVLYFKKATNVDLNLTNAIQVVDYGTKATSASFQEHITDPDTKFSIGWEANPVSMPIQEILFFAFDELASVAQFIQIAPCEVIHGVAIAKKMFREQDFRLSYDGR